MFKSLQRLNLKCIFEPTKNSVIADTVMKAGFNNLI